MVPGKIFLSNHFRYTRKYLHRGRDSEMAVRGSEESWTPAPSGMSWGCGTLVSKKIAPELLVALRNFHEEGRTGLQKHVRALGIVAKKDSPKPARAVIFLHCTEDARFDHLGLEGITINQNHGRVRTGIIPFSGLEVLSGEQTVKKIIPSRYVRPLMEVAPETVGFPDFQKRTDLGGRGVVIGIIDTGIDPKHTAFAGRVTRIWDQVLPGPGVPEGEYGVELAGTLIATSRDYHGHGTHVAGIAAGSDETYNGLAPEATLVVVKTDFMDAHIADGIRYVFRVAEELGYPAVVNLSLGGHFDPHDGTDSLSLSIDDESGPGKIVCCAAGNEGNDNIHAHAPVREGKTKTIRFTVPAATYGEDCYVGLNIWYPGQDRIEVAIRSPDGSRTAYQGVISSGDPERIHLLEEGKVTIVTPGPDPINGDHAIFVLIENPIRPTFPVKSGVWRLQLRGEAIEQGTVDAWTFTGMDSEALFTGTSVADSMKIGSPGAAKSAVTVASYTSKVRWVDSSGRTQYVDWDLHDISDFSSEGPLRNGTRKPDITAPGAMITSALSSDSRVTSRNQVSDGFCVMAGTSMATPFMTGIIAVLLERDPELDPGAIKSLLKANSKIPRKKAGAFHKKWGYGLIHLGDI